MKSTQDEEYEKLSFYDKLVHWRRRRLESLQAALQEEKGLEKYINAMPRLNNMQKGALMAELAQFNSVVEKELDEHLEVMRGVEQYLNNHSDEKATPCSKCGLMAGGKKDEVN